MLILDKTNRFNATTNYDGHIVHYYLFCSCGYSHHARCTLAIHTHASDRARQSSSYSCSSANIGARRTLLHGTSHHYVLDLAWLDACSCYSGGYGVPTEHGCVSVIKCATISFAYWCAGCRYDYSFSSHSKLHQI